MLDLSLSKAEERSFLRALIASHRIRIEVDLADSDETVIDSLTSPRSHVLDGGVQVDSTADVTRSLSLTLLDPKRKLGLIPDSPAQGGLYVDRFIRVRYCVWVAELDGWVEVPVFFGPLATFQHSGPVIELTAVGKEALMLAPHYAVQGYSLAKGERLDNAMKRVGKKAGERRFSIPKIDTKLDKARTVEERAEPWRVLKGGEEDSNGKGVSGLVEMGKAERQLFYNGAGRMCVRRRNREPTYTLRVGRFSEWPSHNFDMTEVRNYIGVSGEKAKGGKGAIEGHAELPPKHPLSPRALGRNGEKRYLAEFIDTALKKSEECDERAADVIDARVKAGLNVDVSCLPIPHLEESDTLRLRTDDYSLDFTADQFSIPLGAGLMSIGANKRVNLKRRR